MTDPFFHTDIEYLKGVGPQRSAVLKKELSIFTIAQLLQHFPFRYVDKTKFISIQEACQFKEMSQIKVRLLRFQELGVSRKKRLVAIVEDDTRKIELIWFKGIKWVVPKLIIGAEYIIYGKVSEFNGKVNISHPDFQIVEPSKKIDIGLQPVYHSTEKLSAKGLHSKGLEKIISNLLPQLRNRLPEILPQSILSLKQDLD